MSKILVDKEILEQALEVFDALEAPASGVINHYELERRKQALRAELAQQAEPAPGWCKHCKQYSIEEPLPAQQAEPVRDPFIRERQQLEQEWAILRELMRTYSTKEQNP